MADTTETQPLETTETLALRVPTMPRDTNGLGNIFGGVILGYIDQAGAIHARKYNCPRLVTKVMREVEFNRPVRIGDILALYARVLRIGRTSITVRVRVEAEDWRTGQQCQVTEGEVVYVHIDAQGQPIPIPRPQ